MSEHMKFSAQLRERAGKGGSRAARREGLVPAVIYGDKKAPITINIEQKAIVKALHTGHLFTSICDIKVGNDDHKVLARDVQLHPVKDTPLHVDFLRVTDRTMISVEVPVNFLNEEECKGLKEGGVLNIVRRAIEVNCRANAIPEEITFDLTEAEIGDSIKISDFTLPDAVTPTITDRDFTVATISAPRAIVEEETTDEEGVEGEEGAENEESADESSEEKSEEGDE